MSYSRDFTFVGKSATKMIVEATSIDNETGKPGTKDPAAGFYVALVKPPQAAACDVSEFVKPGVDFDWVAEFPGAASRYEIGDELLVIGIALNDGGAPDVWQEPHTVESRTG